MPSVTTALRAIELAPLRLVLLVTMATALAAGHPQSLGSPCSRRVCFGPDGKAAPSVDDAGSVSEAQSAEVSYRFCHLPRSFECASLMLSFHLNPVHKNDTNPLANISVTDHNNQPLAYNSSTALDTVGQALLRLELDLSWILKRRDTRIRVDSGLKSYQLVIPKIRDGKGEPPETWLLIIGYILEQQAPTGEPDKARGQGGRLRRDVDTWPRIQAVVSRPALDSSLRIAVTVRDTGRIELETSKCAAIWCRFDVSDSIRVEQSRSTDDVYIRYNFPNEIDRFYYLQRLVKFQRLPVLIMEQRVLNIPEQTEILTQHRRTIERASAAANRSMIFICAASSAFLAALMLTYAAYRICWSRPSPESHPTSVLVAAPIGFLLRRLPDLLRLQRRSRLLNCQLAFAAQRQWGENAWLRSESTAWNRIFFVGDSCPTLDVITRAEKKHVTLLPEAIEADAFRQLLAGLEDFLRERGAELPAERASDWV